MTHIAHRSLRSALRPHRWCWLALLSFLALTIPVAAHASYYARCALTVVVKKAHKPTQKRLMITRKITFKIVAIGKQWGHSNSHCSQRKMKGKTFTRQVGAGKYSALLKKVTRGARLAITYGYSDGLGPHGVVRSEHWRLTGKATKPPKRK